jgi:CO/xanthine dehydrogenase Mo-binding subunit
MAATQFTWIGKPIKRLEDRRFIIGKGKYIDDISLPRMCYVKILRSPYAHARIKKIDVSEALKVKGVVAVVTGSDLAKHFNPLPTFGDPRVVQYPLAVDKVRHVGEGVAAVVAEDKYIAEDALEKIKVDYEVLPALVDPEKAMQETKVLVHEVLGSNIVFQKTMRFGNFEKDYSTADIIVKEKLRWNRSSGEPIETAGAIADYDEGTGILRIWTNALSFAGYVWIYANTLKIPTNKLIVQPVNAGGSFGSKFLTMKVTCLAGMLSILTRRPVKYVEDRIDHILNSDQHGSDRIYEAELAVTKDGIFKALRVKVIDDYGAYFQYGVGTHGNSLAQITGPYTISSVEYTVIAVLTNKNQQGAYRGFGSEVTNWMLERLVESARRKLGMDPVEIRMKNFIPPDKFPYKIPTGNIYDSGNYPAVLKKALQVIDYEKWRKIKEEAKKEGRLIGIGIATAQDRSVFSATEFWFWFDKPAFPITSTPESVTLSIDPMGKFTVTLYSQAMWGNSPETVAAQVVAEEFGIDPYDVNVIYADTSRALPATGPGGSRFSIMVAGAIRGAAEILKAKLKKAAATIMEVREEDLEVKEGMVRIKGTTKGMKISELAALVHMFRHNYNFPKDFTSGLTADYTFDHPYTTLPKEDRSDLGVFYPIMAHACHIAVVEVDRETGFVKLLDYAAVHDCGTIINPKALEGMIIGGIAQGIGTALYEQHLYDQNGNPLNADFTGYVIPSAIEVPNIKVDHVVTPSPFTPYGIKGAGEGGRMIAPAAVANAVEDALEEFGIKVNEIPINYEKIYRALKEKLK